RSGGSLPIVTVILSLINRLQPVRSVTLAVMGVSAIVIHGVHTLEGTAHTYGPCAMASAGVVLRVLGGPTITCGSSAREVHGELLVERLRLFLKDADRHRLAEHHRRIAVAAPVNARQNAVAEGYVVCEFIQLVACTMWQ